MFCKRTWTLCKKLFFQHGRVYIFSCSMSICFLNLKSFYVRLERFPICCKFLSLWLVLCVYILSGQYILFESLLDVANVSSDAMDRGAIGADADVYRSSYILFHIFFFSGSESDIDSVGYPFLYSVFAMWAFGRSVGQKLSISFAPYTGHWIVEVQLEWTRRD